jgi:hypothetical protein
MLAYLTATSAGENSELGDEPSASRKNPQIKFRFQPIAAGLGNHLLLQHRKRQVPVSRRQTGEDDHSMYKEKHSGLRKGI